MAKEFLELNSLGIVHFDVKNRGAGNTKPGEVYQDTFYCGGIVLLKQEYVNGETTGKMLSTYIDTRDVQLMMDKIKEIEARRVDVIAKSDDDDLPF